MPDNGNGTMKHIIIIGDGMADHPIERLGGKTPLQYADTPYMDLLASRGRTGRLITVPEGYAAGSEVAVTAILGYDLDTVYEGRGPLEAASIGYQMTDDDLVLRCNFITVEEEGGKWKEESGRRKVERGKWKEERGCIVAHNGGNVNTDDAHMLIDYLNRELAAPINRQKGYELVKFVCGNRYRHLLVIRGGSKHIVCCPPHDHLGEAWRELLPIEESGKWKEERGHIHLSGQETAALLGQLIVQSQRLLARHPYNTEKARRGEHQANSIWPWSGGYRPQMEPLLISPSSQLPPPSSFLPPPSSGSGSVISAVDVIRGIGHYAGLDIVDVPGATGLVDTNYEGKAAAALAALATQDFVLLHIEAPDEASHDGNLRQKLQAIEDLDCRIVGPIYETTKRWAEPVCIAVLPDHPTPVEWRTHAAEPVPFLIYYKGIAPDDVQAFDEVSCAAGGYGLMQPQAFMPSFLGF